MRFSEPCPEFLLAAATVRRPIDADLVYENLKRTLDWQNFVAVVDKHRIAGLVLQGLDRHAASLPPHVHAELSRRARNVALRAMVTAREAGLLTRALDDEGIPAAVLKGPALSMLAYGDVTLRHSRDIDFLVAPEQVPQAHAVLVKQAYSLYRGDNPTPRQLQAYLEHNKHLSYLHARSQMQVELHGRLYDNVAMDSKPSSPERWPIVDVGHGIRLRTLPMQELLVYLLVHGAGHGWSRLKWLADIASLLPQYPGEVESLLGLRKQMYAKRAVTQGLTLSAHLFGTTRPPLDTDWRDQRLIRLGWEALTQRRASTELYDERFLSTRIRCSQFLLSARPLYLWRQIRFELSVDENGPSRVSPLHRRTPFWRAVHWLRGKARRRTRRGPEPSTGDR